MAEFNPPVQPASGTDLPSMHFPFLSREISPLTPDKSKEIMLKGVGQALESGGKLADEAYTQIARNDTRATVDPIEKEYQDSLQNAYDQLHGSGLDPNSTSLTSQTAQQYGSLPGDLKNLGRDLDIKETARANGKIPETAHYRDLIDTATRLRNKYPGKRELIDQEISRITGVHPANQYVRSLLGDINSFVEAGKAARNRLETQAVEGLKAGTIDYSLFAEWKKGDGRVTDDDIYKALATGGQMKYRHEQNMWSLEENKGTFEEQKRNAESVASQDGYAKLDKAMDGFLVGSDLNHPEKLRDYMDGVTSGRIPMPSGEEAERLAVNLNGFKQKIMTDIRKGWAETANGQSKSLSSRLGDSQEKVLKNLSDELDGWIGVLKSGKDMDIATLAARQVKAAAASGERGLQNDPKLGAITRTLKAIKDTMGPEAFAIFYQQNQQAFDSLRNLDQKSEFMQAAQKLVSQPDIQTGTMDTFKKMVETAKVKGISGQEGAKFYSQLVDMVPAMLGKSVDDQTKENVVNRVFGADNHGVIQLFNKDGVSDKGVPISGQYHVFNTLLSHQNIDHIWKLAKDTNKPELFANTQMWGEHEFGTLLRNEIQDMNTAKIDASGVEIGYDPKDHKFAAKGSNPKGTPPPYLARLLQRVNSGLYSMNHIYEKSGEQSTDIYLYRLLTSSGLNTDVANKMVKAIEIAHGNPVHTEN
jgi:hypothetical protein